MIDSARPVRQPPPRPFDGVRLNGRLVCPMCGEDAHLRRGWWHQVCADLWNLAANPRAQWVELQKFIGDRCWTCGSAEGRTEIEHTRPLWSLNAQERTELKWWLPFNLTLMCRRCHRAKTADEARERFDLGRAREWETRAATEGVVELGLVPDRRRVVRRAS